MGKKILIVDDQKLSRDMIKNYFKEKTSDYEILEAENGQMGLEILGKNPDITLILLDHYMPIMDGITMAEQWKTKNKDVEIPIFMVTTEMGADLKARAKNAGIKAWIPKPCNYDNLLATMKKMGI